jgi:hypothetical protein
VSPSVPAPFGWRCLTSPRVRRTPAPPHRTVRAVCPHTALRSPSAAGMHGHLARSAQRPSRYRGDSRSTKEGFQPRGNPLRGTPVSGGVKVRPLPSGRVVLSRPGKRYYEPLRLPARPGSISATPYTSRLSVSLTLPGLPWCPLELSSHAIPATPEGPRRPSSGGGHQGTGLPPPVTGSTPLWKFTRLPLGSLRATACEVAHVRRTRSSGNLVLWVTRGTHAVGPLPQATRARCPLPGPDFHRRVPEYPRHTTGHL